MNAHLKMIFLGLSITSSWGNGHATNYRGLLRELATRGHDVLFLERDGPWYAAHRDLPEPPYGRTELYGSIEELKDRFEADMREADLIVVGSYVPEGVAIGEWVLDTSNGVAAFYDIDTPVTLAKLERGDEEYLAAPLIPRYDLYLSFTGGPALECLERRYGSPAARAFYCMVDPALYAPLECEPQWDLGYLGTYSPDRQRGLNALLLEPARQWAQGRFAVAGPLYPDTVHWPPNVERSGYLPPSERRAFYAAQRYTLNASRRDMVRTGYAPSVQLFEASACAVPIVSDYWPGLESFFRIGLEIFIAASPKDVLNYLQKVPDRRRRALGERARTRVLNEHTAAHRAEQLEAWTFELWRCARRVGGKTVA